MRHMIINRPISDRTFNEFQCEANLLEELKHQLAARFKGFKCIRIEGDKGNGSSYLLHALANEYNKLEISYTFLQFKEGDKFSELTPYHLKNIDSLNAIFIDNIHLILGNSGEEKLLTDFLSKLANKEVQVFYSSISEETIDHKLMIEHPFSDALLGIILKPLSTEKKYSWASQFLSERALTEIPNEHFIQQQSNAEFLKALDPYITKHKRIMGSNFKEIRLQQEQLYNLELRWLEVNTARLELEPRKNEVIRNQQYEKAADLRGEQKDIEAQISTIREEFDQLKIVPRPSKQAMDLYHNYLRLSILLNSSESSFLQMIQEITNKLDALNNQKKSLAGEHQKTERLELFQELVGWSNVLDKYSI